MQSSINPAFLGYSVSFVPFIFSHGGYFRALFKENKCVIKKSTQKVIRKPEWTDGG